MILDLIQVHIFLISVFDFGKNVCFFVCVDNSSSMHFENRKKYILVLGEGTAQQLDDPAIIVKLATIINCIA